MWCSFSRNGRASLAFVPVGFTPRLRIVEAVWRLYRLPALFNMYEKGRLKTFQTAFYLIPN